MRDAGWGLKAGPSGRLALSADPHPSSLIPHPSSLIPHPGSLQRHPNGDPDLVPNDDKQRVEPAQAAGHPDVVGAA